MANGRYTILGTTYKPLSFEDISRVSQYKQQLHDSEAEGYAQLASKASTVGALLNPQTDQESYKRYQNYVGKIKSESDELAQYGVTPTNKRELLKLYYDYDTELTPIMNAYNTRISQIKQLTDLRSKDNSIIPSYDPSTTSVDDFLNNPSKQFKTVSGNQVKENVSDTMKNYKDSLLHGLSGWSTTAEGLMIQRINQYGLTPADVTDIQQNPSKYPAFAKIMQDAIVQSGATSWNDKNVLRTLYDYAAAGIHSGVGKDTPETKMLPRSRGDGSGGKNGADPGQIDGTPLAYTLVGSNVNLPGRKEAIENRKNYESIQRLINGHGTAADIKRGKEYKANLAKAMGKDYSQLSWKRAAEFAQQGVTMLNQQDYQMNFATGNGNSLGIISQNLTNGRGYENLSKKEQRQAISGLNGEHISPEEYEKIFTPGNGTFLKWTTKDSNRYAPSSYYHSGRLALHSNVTGKDYLFDNDAGMNSFSWRGMNLGQYLGANEMEYDRKMANIWNNPDTNPAQKQQQYLEALREKNTNINDAFGVVITSDNSANSIAGNNAEKMQQTKQEYKLNGNN